MFNIGVMSRNLNPIDADRALITELGGPSQVAKLLGFKKAGSVQRVQNWIVRGIPPAIKLAHPHVFLKDLKRSRPRPATAVVE